MKPYSVDKDDLALEKPPTAVTFNEPPAGPLRRAGEQSKEDTKNDSEESEKPTPKKQAQKDKGGKKLRRSARKKSKKVA